MNSRTIYGVPTVPATIFLVLVITFCELYVAKFSMRISPKLQMPLVISYPILLLAGCFAYVRLGHWLRTKSDSEKLFTICYITIAVATVAVSLASLVIISPETLKVDRWSALSYFWDAALNGHYPYSAATHMHNGNHPSGLPGLMVLSLPFYLMGDVGLMQPVGYAFLFAIFYFLSPLRAYTKTGILAFFVSLPPVLWELTVRSDFGTNILLVCGVILLSAKRQQNPQAEVPWKAVIYKAALFGFLLSTRLVLLLPFFLMSPNLVGKRKVLPFWAMTGIITMLTLLPFYLWDPHLFMKFNPLILNGNKSPLWVTAPSLLIAIFGGYYLKTPGDKFFTAGMLSTFIVGVSFFIGLHKEEFLSILYAPKTFDFFYFHTGIIFMFIAIVLYLHAPVPKKTSQPFEIASSLN